MEPITDSMTKGKNPSYPVIPQEFLNKTPLKEPHSQMAVI